MAETPGDCPPTIFCAADFSQTGALAARQAADLARRHGARLVLGHVTEPIPIDPYPLPMALPDGEAGIRKAALERLEELGASLRSPTLEVEVRLDIGSPGPQLVAMAQQEQAHLLVIGTRGLTGFERLVLGSTAEYVVRRAHCPVLSIHPEDHGSLEAAEVVLVPTDLSEDAEVAIDAFLSLVPGAEIPRVELVFADSTPPYLDALSHAQLERSHAPDVRREEIETRLAPMVERFRAKGFDVAMRVVDGGPVEAITELAERVEADLIVMSTHGRSALLNALLGRTAQRIVQHAGCPVLTVCPKRRRASGD